MSKPMIGMNISMSGMEGSATVADYEICDGRTGDCIFVLTKDGLNILLNRLMCGL